MTRRHSPIQQLKEAKQIARDHGCFVVEKHPAPGVTHYLLYREMSGHPNVYIGRRVTPAGIRSLVCKATGFH